MNRLAKIFILVLTGLALLILLVLANVPAVVNTGIVQATLDQAGFLLAQRQLAELLPGQESGVRRTAGLFSPEEIRKVNAGQIVVLTATEAIGLAKAEPRPYSDKVIFIANTPHEFAGLTWTQRVERLRQATAAAIKIGARVVVDSSASDQARTYPGGFDTVQETRQAGLVRVVIFDGGHHLSALALAPDLILVPVMHGGTNIYGVHSYLRDAIPLDTIRRLVRETGEVTTICTMPRLATTVKYPSPMGELARQCLEAVFREERSAKGPGDCAHCPTAAWTGSHAAVTAGGDLFLNLVLRTGEPTARLLERTRTRLEAIESEVEFNRVFLAINYGDTVRRRVNRVQAADLKAVFRQFGRENGYLLQVINEPFAVPDLLWQRWRYFWKSPPFGGVGDGNVQDRGDCAPGQELR